MKCNRKLSQTPLLGLCPALIYVANSQPVLNGTGRGEESVFRSERSLGCFAELGEKGVGVQLVVLILWVLERDVSIL